jgi:hypothetical protein
MREEVYSDSTMRASLWFDREWEVDRVLGSKTDPTKSNTSWDVEKASKQASKNVKIWEINYNISKNWDTLKFDNTKNWWADFNIKKSDILIDWKVNDDKIRKVLSDANITDWIDKIIENVKKEFKEKPSTN